MHSDHEHWYFQSIITTVNQYPLLEPAGLATAVVEYLQSSLWQQDKSQIWGYLVLPDTVRLVMEVEFEKHYHINIETLKIQTEQQLCTLIHKTYPGLLDAVTFYHPLWKNPTCSIWQAGYHTQQLNTPYEVSNKVAELVNKPVELGLVESPGEWPFSSFTG